MHHRCSESTVVLFCPQPWRNAPCLVQSLSSKGHCRCHLLQKSSSNPCSLKPSLPVLHLYWTFPVCGEAPAVYTQLSRSFLKSGKMIFLTQSSEKSKCGPTISPSSLSVPTLPLTCLNPRHLGTLQNILVGRPPLPQTVSECLSFPSSSPFPTLAVSLSFCSSHTNSFTKKQGLWVKVHCKGFLTETQACLVWFLARFCVSGGPVILT